MLVSLQHQCWTVIWHSMQNRCMKWIASIGLALILPAVSASALTDVEVERELTAVARHLSSNLPMGNNASMLISVSAGPGRRFRYFSVQSIPARQWSAEMRSHSRRIAVNDYCTNPEMKPFRANTVTVSWQISDMDGVYVLTNTVSPSECR